MGSLSAAKVNMGNPVVYAYPNARVMALRSFMLKEEDIRALASSKNLQEYTSLLEHTSYKQDIGKISEPTVARIESALLTNLVKTNRLAIEIAPRSAYSFFDKFNDVYEIEFVKLVLNDYEAGRSGCGERDYSIYNPILSPEMKKYAKEVAEAKNRTEAIELLKRTRYSFINKLPAEEVRYSGQVSSLLDKKYYEDLWSAVGGLSSNDAPYARRLIGTEIDVVNILTLMRSAITSSKAGKYLINGGFRLADKAPNLAGRDLQETVAALSDTYYRDLVSEGFRSYEKEKSLIRLELSFRKYILGEYRRVFKGSPFHIGVLLGFLKLKEYELKNLRAIAVAVDNGLAPKDIMEMVIT